MRKFQALLLSSLVLAAGSARAAEVPVEPTLTTSMTSTNIASGDTVTFSATLKNNRVPEPLTTTMTVEYYDSGVKMTVYAPPLTIMLDRAMMNVNASIKVPTQFSVDMTTAKFTGDLVMPGLGFDTANSTIVYTGKSLSAGKSSAFTVTMKAK